VKTAAKLIFVVGLLLGLSAPAWAQEDPKAHWAQIRRYLREGAYRDALQSLDVLLAITPNDPWAQVYRSLCELRLKSPSPFARLSPEQLAALQQDLRREETAQRQSQSQRKAMERQVRLEQARWEQELKALEQEAKREEQRQRSLARVEAVQRVRAEEAQQRSLAQHEALQQAGGERPEEPQRQTALLPESAEERPPPAFAPGGPSVELSPVKVPTTQAPPAVEEPEELALPKREPPPPGAVQINARQLSVSPDRKVALAEGDVEVLFENALLTCDRLTLFTDTKDAYAEGRVRLEEGTSVFRGEMVHYNFNSKKGRFLQGTVSSPPWHEHGRSVEHIAEGVYEVTPGYLTSCELEPPHFKFYGRRAMVFAGDRVARVRHATLLVDRVPFFFFPWLAVADRQTPFFLIPGKKKPWEQFALMGYRYEWPPDGHKGALRLDWRRTFGWGVGVDHQFDTDRLGKGLVKLYYNEEPNRRRPKSDLPKGADVNRYRAMWRHRWLPMKDTVVTADIQEFSDKDYRRELLFREEYTEDDVPESFVSVVTNTDSYSLTGQVRKRMNRFQTATEAFPALSIDTREQQIADTKFFGSSSLGVSNLQAKNAHSDVDADVVKVDWRQGVNYALTWFRPVEVTPNATVTQTYYTKDAQGGVERPQGKRDLISGQFSGGMNGSLKLFRLFPVQTNLLGLNLHMLRHVLTPTVSYTYTHRPTVPNDILYSPSGSTPTNAIRFGLENKLQTKRPVEGKPKQLASVDLARLLIDIPYTFHGNHNKQGGRLGDWTFDLELYPWPWMRLETGWSYPSHFLKGSRDERVTSWGLDLVVVGGQGARDARAVPDLQRPTFVESYERYEPGARGGLAFLLPRGQWFLGWRHGYSYNDKTEETVEFNFRPSEKWEIGTFHRVTLKEVVGGAKRFNNLREYQYSLRRDLHDWVGEVVYRVDREFGEELFFVLTLKAYPDLPIEMGESYHQPKIGSQSSPFSPLKGQTTLLQP
jgi:hypothetical protein